jgi:hypothetical protein
LLLVSALLPLACKFPSHMRRPLILTNCSLFSCVALIFHGVVSCRQHRYNKIGVNRDSIPIDITSKHPPESTAYNAWAWAIFFCSRLFRFNDTPNYFEYLVDIVDMRNISYNLRIVNYFQVKTLVHELATGFKTITR